ncbi:hypothetical protein [Tateyamaria sp.]
MNFLVSIVALLTFIGYSFLTDYYGQFGLSFADLNSDARHFLVRGVDLIRYDFQLLGTLLAVAVASMAVGAPYAIKLWSRRIPVTALVIPFAGIFLFLSEVRVTQLAQVLYNRDLNADTSALRQLVCLATEGESAVDFLNSEVFAGNKILVLSRTDDRIVAFFSPKFDVPGVDVDVFTIKIPNSYVLRDSSARAALPSTADRNSCFSG